MFKLLDKNGAPLFLGAFVIIHELPHSNEFGELEFNRQSSLGRTAKICEIEGAPPGVFWFGDLEIKLEYVMIMVNGLSSMSLGAFGENLEVVNSTKPLEMLYDNNNWKYIDKYGEEQKSDYFKILVDEFGYSI